VKLLQENRDNVRFLLDSGAFTAWKAGKPIALDDYCRFIESLPFESWRYFMLDVIGDPAATMRNYETMLKRGFNPIPIFTRGEDPSVLDDYYKTSDLVAIGGLVGTPGNKGFVKGIMEKVGGRRVHWLGFFDCNFVKHYRPYSCDSSTWKVGATFKNFNVVDGSKIRQVNQRVMVKMFEESANFRHQLNAFGIINARGLVDLKNDAKQLNEFNIYQTLKFQKLVQDKLQVKYFLAMTDSNTVQTAIRRFKQCHSTS